MGNDHSPLAKLLLDNGHMLLPGEDDYSVMDRDGRIVLDHVALDTVTKWAQQFVSEQHSEFELKADDTLDPREEAIASLRRKRNRLLAERESVDLRLQAVENELHYAQSPMYEPTRENV